MPNPRSQNDLYNKTFYTAHKTRRLGAFHLFFESTREMRQPEIKIRRNSV